MKPSSLVTKVVLSFLALFPFISVSATQTPQHLQKTRNISSTTTPRKVPANDFCLLIDQARVVVNGVIVDKNTKQYTEKRSTKGRNDILAQFSAVRKENTTKYTELINELSHRATTTEQKATLAAFTTTLTRAQQTKNTALDTLFKNYEEKIRRIEADREEANAQAHTKLIDSITSAQLNARVDCTKGVQGSIVRTNLKHAIEEARKTFDSTIKSNNKRSAIPESERTALKKEIKSIEETYKKTVKGAIAPVHQAFNATSTARTGTTTQR
jgi:hypothetical protein